MWQWSTLSQLTTISADLAIAGWTARDKKKSMHFTTTLINLFKGTCSGRKKHGSQLSCNCNMKVMYQIHWHNCKIQVSYYSHLLHTNSEISPLESFHQSTVYRTHKHGLHLYVLFGSWPLQLQVSFLRVLGITSPLLVSATNSNCKTTVSWNGKLTV